MRTHKSLSAALAGICFGLFFLHGGCGPDNSAPIMDEPTTEDPQGGAGSVAPLSAAFTVSKSGLTATVDASTLNGNGEVRWDWTDDGTWDTEWSTLRSANHTYDRDGTYTIRQEVRNLSGLRDTAVQQFIISRVNNKPTAAFAVNVVSGVTASVDASSSADVEEATDDLSVRWDWQGDGIWDTDWTLDKTAEYTYDAYDNYEVRLQVRDWNGDTDEAKEDIEVSPIAIRSSFYTAGIPYLIRVHFRLLNTLTNEQITPSSDPPLGRRNFTIFEDDIPVDISETNQILTVGTKPLHLVLVLDYTGSMHDADGIDDMVAAAKLFIDGQPDNTYLSLWAFWERQGGYDEINDYIQCTADGKDRLKANLDEFTSEARDQGATEIWDLLENVLNQKFLPFDNGVTRAIAFLSDGHDTTSEAGISKLVTIATREKAVAIFPIGLALRADQYPNDEPKLKRLAEDTNGTYFTVRQLSDLSQIFDQMAEDLRSDLTLSYITLQNGGTHEVRVECEYLDGFATLTSRIPMQRIAGDVKQGLLFVRPGETTDDSTEYVVSARYIPRNLDNFRIRIADAEGDATLSLYESDALLLASEGWSISPDVDAGERAPSDGWYSITGPSPLEFGAFGRFLKCTVDRGDFPKVEFEVPSLTEQIATYGDKRMVFMKNRSIRLEVPTIMTGITTSAVHGAPADPELDSANAGQSITVSGQGLGPGDVLILMTIDSTGGRHADFVPLLTAFDDGRSAEFELPRDIVTNHVYLFDDYSPSKFLLQIVPRVTDVRSGRYFGSGFIEGQMLAIVGDEEYLDSGPDSDDGIDVIGQNTAFELSNAFDASRPIIVITEGGTSATFVPE